MDLGDACSAYQHATLRDLTSVTFECDEIWNFVGMKDKNVPADRQGEPHGSLDVDGDLRGHEAHPGVVCGTAHRCGWLPVHDGPADPAQDRPQITTDGLAAYAEAIGFSFGARVDWATIQKTYASDPSDERRYSPPVCTGVDVRVRTGAPDPERISTSYVGARTSRCG